MPRHALQVPLQISLRTRAVEFVRISRVPRTVVRIAVPALAVSALGVGAAFSGPQQGVTTAAPATSAPLAARSTESAVSRSEQRAALSAAELKRAQDARTAAAKAAQVAAAKQEADQKAAAKKAAEKRAAQPARTGSAGTRYATITLNLRSAPQDAARTSVDLSAGAKVAVTGYTLDEWAQVKADGANRWVKKKYLSTSKPKTSSAASASGSGGVNAGAPCSSGSGVENGLTPDAIKVHRAICHAFPSVTSYGGVRVDSLPEHPAGRAVDAMVSGSTGWAVANWVRAHAKELGVSQVIHAQKIWTVQRSGEGWRSMSDRGSASANHYDHVHVTVYGNSAG